jgi:5-methylcytosine-specific restriction enzyme A
MPTAPRRFRPAPTTAAVRTPPEQPHKRLYGLKRWLRLSRRFRRVNPLCVECAAAGRTVAAQVVDHIRPHKGDETLFWDWKNLQSLCGSCHSAKTVAQDGGFGRTPTQQPRA